MQTNGLNRPWRPKEIPSGITGRQTASDAGCLRKRQTLFTGSAVFFYVKNRPSACWCNKLDHTAKRYRKIGHDKKREKPCSETIHWVHHTACQIKWNLMANGSDRSHRTVGNSRQTVFWKACRKCRNSWQEVMGQACPLPQLFFSEITLFPRKFHIFLSIHSVQFSVFVWNKGKQ